MQFDDVDVVGASAGLLIDNLRRRGRHVVADHLHEVTRFERRWKIGRHGLARDHDTRADAVLLRKRQKLFVQFLCNCISSTHFQKGSSRAFSNR